MRRVAELGSLDAPLINDSINHSPHSLRSPRRRTAARRRQVLDHIGRGDAGDIAHSVAHLVRDFSTRRANSRASRACDCVDFILADHRVS